MENHMDNKIKTCEDCIHFEVCCYVDKLLPPCDSFKDKSKFIELPCAIGDTVFMISYGHDTWDDTEYKVIIQTTFRLDMLSSFNKRIFLRREEAEKRLEELK